MIPVVMEEAVRNTRTWRGTVGMVLGGRLYTDMSGDFSDETYFQRCVDDLYDKILDVIGRPITYMSSTLDLDSFGDDFDSISPRDYAKPSSNNKPLTALSISDVSRLLEKLNLGLYTSIFRDNMVDGPSLNSCECVDHVKELGATITVKAKVLFDKILLYQRDGVPLDMLTSMHSVDTAEGKEYNKRDSPSKVINVERKSGAKAQNRIRRNDCDFDCDYIDKSDIYYPPSEEKNSSPERYNESPPPGYDDNNYCTEDVELWECLKCGRENLDEDAYCVYCATVRGRGAGRRA